MKTMILSAKTAALTLCLCLLSIFSMAQDRNSSGETPGEITEVKVLTSIPPQAPKSENGANFDVNPMPRVEVSGNRDLDIENYRVAILTWAKQNSKEFLALPEATRDLFYSQQFAVLFDQAVNKSKENTQNEK